MPDQGLFITFEGGEGSGKSTQAHLLSKALQADGREVVITREPGGTPEAEKIRDLLVQREGGDWSAGEECLLVLTARVHHVRTLIDPALNRGDIVICDRFMDSTLVYQGFGRGMAVTDIEKLHEIVLGSFEPDLTFLLDVPVEDGLTRAEVRLAGIHSDQGKQEDRFERMDMEFHKKLRDGFLTLAKQNPHRIIVLDARQSIEELHDQIMAYVKEKFGA